MGIELLARRLVGTNVRVMTMNKLRLKYGIQRPFLLYFSVV